MTGALPRSARRVQEALRSHGIDVIVRELAESTRTAPEAAAAVGCPLGAIVKSLVFRGEISGRALLALVSGASRADEEALAAGFREPVGRADADFVRAATGFAIGGVAPVGHPEPLETLVDEDLLGHELLWAAAGTPRTLFPITPPDLVRVCGGRVGSLAIRERR